MEEQNEPKLRFPEFNGAWSNSTLKKVSSNVAYGIGASSTEFDGVNKYLRITDIDEDTRQFKPDPLTSPKGDNFEKYKLKEGDIVFARTGASVGKSYLYNPEDGNLIYAGFLIRFNISKADPRFIYLMTFRSEYDKWVKVYSMRSGQPGLNAEEYKNWEIFLPNLKEQQKIADFLSSVDQKIQQLRRKKKLLEEYKKGVMQKLFSQEVRFKDDNGEDFPDWESRRLEEILDINYGKDYKDLGNGDIPLIGTGGIMGYVDNHLYDKPSVLIGRKGTIDKPQFIDEPFWTVDTLFYTKVSESVDPYFAYLLVSRINLLKYNEASGVPSLSVRSLNSIKVKLPASFKEQLRIAKFVKNIDEKISHIEEKIDLTQTFKKGLLQQMFI